MNRQYLLLYYLSLTIIMKELSNSGSGIMSFSNVSKSMKQQELSFQNLKPRTQYQLQPRTQVIFTSQRTQPISYDPSPYQLSSRGPRITPLTKSEGSLEESFRKAQSGIRNHIQVYNQKINEIVEALHDMQIRDLMYFNEILENNQRALEETATNQIMQLPKEQQRRIYELERTVTKAIANPIRSFETRATLDSRNNRKTFSQNSSTIVNRKSFADSHRNSHRDSEAESQGNIYPTLRLNSQVNSQKDSKSMKPSVVKDSLQDTPESVKSKLSYVGKVKPEKAANIGMFDRIMVCESVEELVETQSPNPNCKNKENKIRPEYRYGRMSQE